MGNNWVIFLLLFSSIGHLFLFLSIWWDTLHPERAEAGIYAALQFAIFSQVCMIIYIFYQPRLLYGYLLVSRDSIFSQPIRNISHTQVSPLTPIMTNPIDSGKPWSGSLNEKESILEVDRQQQPASPEKIDQWRELVHEYMTTEKPFLQQSFRLHDLAIAIDIPQHHCSYIINYVFERNFNEWVNEYRVAYFIRSYTHDASRLTLEALAREAGFGNRRSLHNAFMKIHGQPPGIYLQKLITA
jgi:AraC-like DNA-binding protein